MHVPAPLILAARVQRGSVLFKGVPFGLLIGPQPASHTITRRNEDLHCGASQLIANAGAMVL